MPEAVGAGPAPQGEPTLAKLLQLQLGEVELGHRQPRAPAQILERIEKFGEAAPAEAQKAAQRVQPAVPDQVGAQILEQGIAWPGEPDAGRFEHRLGERVVMDTHGLEPVGTQRIGQACALGHRVPDRRAEGIVQKALDRAVDQSMHACHIPLGAPVPGRHALTLGQRR
jgi:hypothetical protein